MLPQFIVKAKGDNTEQCKQLVDLVAKAGVRHSPLPPPPPPPPSASEQIGLPQAKVGSFVKEQAFGDFAAEWMKAVDARAELEM